MSVSVKPPSLRARHSRIDKPRVRLCTWPVSPAGRDDARPRTGVGRRWIVLTYRAGTKRDASSLRIAARERDPECRSLAGMCMQVEPRVEKLAKSLDDRKTDAFARVLGHVGRRRWQRRRRRVARRRRTGRRVARYGEAIARRSLERRRERFERIARKAGAGVLYAQAPAREVGVRGLPRELDAALRRVLERVQQQVLRDAVHLHFVAVDDQRLRTFGDEVEAALGRDELQIRRELAQQGAGIETMDRAPFLAGVEARLRRQVIEQCMERRDAASEHLQEFLARPRLLHDGGDVAHQVDVPAKVMRGLPPRFGTLLLELADLCDRLLERADAVRRFGAREASVLRDA